MDDIDVLVVGAGPTGLTAACALALQGASVRVIDSACGPSQSSRANFLHARGAEVLDRLGRWGICRRRRYRRSPSRCTWQASPSRWCASVMPDCAPAAPQSRIEEALRERFAELSGAVEWGRRWEEVQQESDRVVALVESGSQIRARWLVGVGGAHSATGKLVGEAFPGAPVADTRLLADAYRHGRVLIAGDAAHLHSPMGGQGMKTVIGDAENLVWKLALVLRGKASSALLDTYQAKRRPLAETVLHTTTATSRLQLGEGAVLREHVLLTRRPAIGQRWATAVASQLGVSYRKGPLGGRRPLTTSKSTEPGDRFPDLACLREDGSRTRLHGELGSHWVLLAPTTDPRGGATVRDPLGDDIVVLRPAAEGLSDLLLVRPDALIDMMVGAVIYRVLQPVPLDIAEAEWYLRSVYRQVGLLPAVPEGG
ncbi:FAD-dependent oxidoreductase [Nocardiopsis oceani]